MVREKELQLAGLNTETVSGLISRLEDLLGEFSDLGLAVDSSGSVTSLADGVLAVGYVYTHGVIRRS